MMAKLECQHIILLVIVQLIALHTATAFLYRNQVIRLGKKSTLPHSYTPKSQFSFFDSDGNGKLSIEEYERVPQFRITALMDSFDSADLDGDGRINDFEFFSKMAKVRYSAQQEM
ncbi:uncharacterized protein LOC144447070 [Glandiceps talaboti]